MDIVRTFKNSKFGVAGFPPNFFKSSFGKKREGIFPWLESLGLNLLEVQCTYGVKMPDETARAYNTLSKQHGIELSIHAPY
ncbi:MAG: hypothetical protein FWF01_04100, partial [Alphaproteobacteria bacterium]|nr:hypothetical protein [Alphaproteobacteria bacterium]